MNVLNAANLCSGPFQQMCVAAGIFFKSAAFLLPKTLFINPSFYYIHLTGTELLRHFIFERQSR